VITEFKRSATVFFDESRGHYRARFRRARLSDQKEKIPDSMWRGYGLPVPMCPSDRHDAAALKWAALRAKELDEQDALVRATASAGRAPEKMSLAAVFELYQAENPRLVSAETKERDRVSFDAIKRHVDVDALRPEDIDDPFAVRYRNARMDDTVLARRGDVVTDTGRPVRSRTIRNELDLLKRLCEFAMKWSRRTGCAALQFTELPDLEEQDSLQEPLTPDQVAAVLDLANDRDRRILIYGICTMLRKTPLLGHCGQWLDWRRAWLTVPSDVMKKGRAKRRRGLSIPLCDTAMGQLGGEHIGYTWPNSATGRPLTWLDDTLHSLVELRARTGPPCHASVFTTSARPARPGCGMLAWTRSSSSTSWDTL
jgi:integrase